MLLNVTSGRRGFGAGERGACKLSRARLVTERYALVDGFDAHRTEPGRAWPILTQPEVNRLRVLGDVNHDRQGGPVAVPFKVHVMRVREDPEGEPGTLDTQPRPGPALNPFDLCIGGKANAFAPVLFSIDGVNKRAQVGRCNAALQARGGLPIEGDVLVATRLEAVATRSC